MKNFFIIIFSILLSFNAICQHRIYQNIHTTFSAIFDKKEKMNPYYLNDNPAYLKYENSSNLMSLKTSLSNTTGNYKKIIEPNTEEIYQLNAFGKKAIDTNQTFLGSFSFQRMNKNNWQWIFTKNYQSHPFLLGDSTTGDSRFNGISLLAQYSNILYKKLLLGISLNYLVDEALKNISPRPTSEHREINTDIGIGYFIDDEMSIGITTSIIDNIEQINYSEDEGAKTKETILLKFKGYDFIDIIRKKNESRYSYHNGYYGNLSFQYNLPNLFSIIGFVKSGFEKFNIKDDAINPQTVGFWKKDYAEFGFQSLNCFSQNYFLGFKYAHTNEFDWAMNPKYSSVFQENTSTISNFSVGIEYNNHDLVFGIEGNMELINRKSEDYYSHVFWHGESSTFSLSVGLDYYFIPGIRSFISYSFEKKNNYNNSLIYSLQSNFFLHNRLNDILYCLTDMQSHKIDMTSTYAADFGIIFLNLGHIIALPSNGTIFKDSKRSYFYSSIEFQVIID